MAHPCSKFTPNFNTMFAGIANMLKPSFMQPFVPEVGLLFLGLQVGNYRAAMLHGFGLEATTGCCVEG